jgi:hypothetical protein
MVPGFNHNIQFNGKTYHIQTEDSGLGNPHIITLLYLGGNIIAKKKTSYADIAQMEHLPKLVRNLMEEQHKAMLRELVKGGYDAPLSKPVQEVAALQEASPSPLGAAGPVAPIPSVDVPEINAGDVETLFGSEKGERSLDEIILSYLADDA